MFSRILVIYFVFFGWAYVSHAGKGKGAPGAAEGFQEAADIPVGNTRVICHIQDVAEDLQARGLVRGALVHLKLTTTVAEGPSPDALEGSSTTDWLIFPADRLGRDLEAITGEMAQKFRGHGQNVESAVRGAVHNKLGSVNIST